MVFFTCNACGESLKKNQVEKHYKQKCRNCDVLTCVDCHKDFPGDSYASHTKCITEAEKYSGKGWTPKSSFNKGEKKQQAWIENLQNLISQKSSTDLDQDVRRVLETIMQHENIPRKKKKFENFVKNIIRGVKPATIDKTWDVFEEAMKPTGSNDVENTVQNGCSENANGATNDKENEGPLAEETENGSDGSKIHPSGVQEFQGLDALDKKSKKKKKKMKNKENDEEVVQEKKSKKRKVEETEADESPSPKKKVPDQPTDNPGLPAKFNWESTIEMLLTKKDGEMKENKLKKKIIAEYRSVFTESVKTDEELSAKLAKKLKKNPRFVLLKDKVKLKPM